MKQRAGLGKKVSSIFDGVPLPKTGQEVVQAPGRPEPQMPPVQRQADADIVSPPRQMPAEPPQMPKPSPVAAPQSPKPAAVAVPQAPKPAPVASPQVPRTVPAQAPQLKISEHALPKKTASAVFSVGDVSRDSWQRLIQKLFSGNSELDARNRKAIAMVGMLSVVLVVVVMWSGVFSGSSQRSANSVVAAADAAGGEVRIDWTPPEPYPLAMRDPMQTGSKTGGGSSGMGGALIVKSIVYSDNPTAVINGQIIRMGQAIGGSTITKINKDSVEFAANGKSWKQQVE